MPHLATRGTTFRVWFRVPGGSSSPFSRFLEANPRKRTYHLCMTPKQFDLIAPVISDPGCNMKALPVSSYCDTAPQTGQTGPLISFLFGGREIKPQVTRRGPPIRAFFFRTWSQYGSQYLVHVGVLLVVWVFCVRSLLG